MFFLREEKTLATSDGTYVVQTIFRSQPQMVVTAVAPDFSDFQSRQSNDIQPMGRGYEHVRDAKLVENATRWATEAVQKLGAKPVDVGRYDLVLHPTHLWLTIHESIAHHNREERLQRGRVGGRIDRTFEQSAALSEMFRPKQYKSRKINVDLRLETIEAVRIHQIATEQSEAEARVGTRITSPDNDIH